MSERMEQLRNDLAAVIARHAAWLDGRTFQEAALHVAGAYFPADDLADLVDVEALAEALSAELDTHHADTPPNA